jgi:hypothetical protein
MCIYTTVSVIFRNFNSTRLGGEGGLSNVSLDPTSGSDSKLNVSAVMPDSTFSWITFPI